MDIETASKSVVALRATVPDDAFTAAGLGTSREGSGVVIGNRGLVLTIGYLITEAEEVWLTTQDGKVHAAHPLAYDQETGFGLVQSLGDLGLPAVPLGKSGAAHLGDAVTLVDGLGNATRASIVARQEFAGYWEYLLEEAIFTAPAHESWGGAALLGGNGELLGIGSLRLQMIEKGQVADINMAVPIDLLPPILDDLLSYGRPSRPPRPWLGIYAAESNEQILVAGIAANSPAQAAGIKSGDAVLTVGGEPIADLATLWRQVWACGAAGAEVSMKLFRDGKILTVRIRSADRSALLKAPRFH